MNCSYVRVLDFMNRAFGLYAEVLNEFVAISVEKLPASYS